MKTLGIIGTTALLLVLGTNIPAFAQEHQEEAKPAQHEQEAKPAKEEAPTKQEAAPKQAEKAQPAKEEAQPKTAARQEAAAKPAQQQSEAKPARQTAETKPTQQPQAKAAKQETQIKPEQREQQAKAAKPETQNTQEARSGPVTQGQARRSPVEEQTQRSAPALRLSVRNDSRIPDDRFHSNFGSGHRFRIGTPRMVGGYSRFQYGGYWFGFVQPWPVGWYYTDDVYVDFIDGGYYLCNPSYPDARIAISVVL